jgi:exosortase
VQRTSLPDDPVENPPPEGSLLSTVSNTTDLPLATKPAAAEGDPSRGWLGFSWSTWVLGGLIAVLMIAIYRHNLVRLWINTNPINGEGNWGHAIAVPIIGLYYLYLKRDELLATPVRPLLGLDLYRGRFVSAAVAVVIGLGGYFALEGSEASLVAYLSKLMLAIALLGTAAAVVDWGLATLIGGLLLSIYGIYPGQNDFLWDVGGVVTLFGVVLTLGGWGIMRIAWFPVLFLLCAIPWPPLLYSALAMPLQQLAAQAAVFTLQVTGVESDYAGTKIFMKIPGPDGGQWRTLNVAEACAGLRSLMTFVSLAAAIAFLSSRPLWQKLVITFSAVPIAIFCNVLRVSGQGLLDRYVSQELSQDFAHQFVGLVMLAPAFVMVLGVCWILDQLFIDEPDTPALASGPKGGA